MAKTKYFQVISPDGFEIKPTGKSRTRGEAIVEFQQWKSNYERQGYYSTGNRDRLPLDDLHIFCSIGEYDAKKNLLTTSAIQEEEITVKS